MRFQPNSTRLRETALLRHKILFCENVFAKVPNQSFHYTHRIITKRVTVDRAHLRVIAPRQYSYLCRCWNGSKPYD